MQKICVNAISALMMTNLQMPKCIIIIKSAIQKSTSEFLTEIYEV